MLQDLKTIAKSHSISKVIATLFVPQIFIDTDTIYQEVINDSNFYSYTKKVGIKTQPVNIFDKKIQFDKEKPTGFILESYNKNGSLDFIYRLDNDHQSSQVSIENRNYPGWETYKEKVIEDWKNLNEIQPFFVQAIGLNFRDEFIWEGEENIPLDEIFKIESDVLNTKFFNSINGTLTLSTHSEEEGILYEEHTEISFSNQINRVLVNHRIAIRLDEIYQFKKILEENKIISSLDFAHRKNKSILEDVLHDSVQVKIGLKK